MHAWQGNGDVGAAVAFLEAQPDVTAIGGWGISLGGEVLLGASGLYSQVEAIVSDGATHRTFPDSREAPPGRVPVSEQMTWLMYNSARLFTGDTPPPKLVDSLAATEDIRFLLIAAEETPLEIDYNERFMQIIGERGTLWVAPGVRHVGAFSALREDYTRRLLAFFDTVLLEAGQDSG